MTMQEENLDSRGEQTQTPSEGNGQRGGAALGGDREVPDVQPHEEGHTRRRLWPCAAGRCPAPREAGDEEPRRPAATHR